MGFAQFLHVFSIPMVFELWGVSTAHTTAADELDEFEKNIGEVVHAKIRPALELFFYASSIPLSFLIMVISKVVF